MSKSTRRSFMTVAGAALSAPVAAAAISSSWLPSGGNRNPLEARLAELEDRHAILALNAAFARHVTAGDDDKLAAIVAEPTAIAKEPGLYAIALEAYGERDVIEIAPDRQTATSRLHFTLHSETEMEADCTLVEMARQQGSSVIRDSESAVLENAYVRRDGVWKILSSTRRT